MYVTPITASVPTEPYKDYKPSLRPASIVNRWDRSLRNLRRVIRNQQIINKQFEEKRSGV